MEQASSVNPFTTPINTNPLPITGNSLSKKKKGIILFLIVLFLLFILGSFFFMRKFLAKNQTSSPSYDAPLFSFSGKIVEIYGDSMKVTQETFNQKNTSYIFKITPKTQFSSVPIFIPYSLKNASESAKVKSPQLSDLRVGQSVGIVSVEDLTIPQDDGFDTSSVTIMPGLTSVRGILIQIGTNSFVIRANPPSVSQVKDYTFNTNQETEIVLADKFDGSNNPEKRQLTLSELKNSKEIVVYTENDLNFSSTSLAKKIEIVTP